MDENSVTISAEVEGRPVSADVPLNQGISVLTIEDALFRAANPAPRGYASAVIHVIRMVALGSVAKQALLALSPMGIPLWIPIVYVNGMAFRGMDWGQLWFGGEQLDG